LLLWQSRQMSLHVLAQREVEGNHCICEFSGCCNNVAAEFVIVG